MSSDSARILHLADVHLGGSGPVFGDRVAEHQERISKAFTRCVDIALAQGVDAVVIAGDLFETRRPSERTLQAAVAQLRRLAANVPCFLLPGTHDCLDGRSVYLRPEWSIENLHIWTAPEPATFRTIDGKLAIHGHPQSANSATHSPLSGLLPDPEARFNIALAHGSVALGHLDDDVLISLSEIAASGMNYIALGHWHDTTDYSQGKVTAWYCGSPEVILLNQRNPGSALLVTLTASGVKVEPQQTGTLQPVTANFDVEEFTETNLLVAEIHKFAGPDVLLNATLTGFCPPEITLDVDEIYEELAPQFFRLHLSDETVPDLTDTALDDISSQMISTIALNNLRHAITRAQESGDEKAERIARRALQTATALFAGREVV